INRCVVASLTWIAYDIITSMDDEARLRGLLMSMIRARWTLPKALYIVLRYYAPLWLIADMVTSVSPGTQLSDLVSITTKCASFPPLQAVGPIVLWILVDTILILRINALYGNNKKSMGITKSINLRSQQVVIPVTIYCFRLSRPVPAPEPFASVAGCLVLNVNTIKMGLIKAAVIAFMILNMFYLGLTLVKFVQNVRSLKKLNVQSMISIFVAEGTVYFVIGLAANTVDIVLSSGSLIFFSYIDLAQFWLGAFYSYAGCHLILHLRKKTAQRANNDNTVKTSTFVDLAEMEFQCGQTTTLSGDSMEMIFAQRQTVTVDEGEV
ncbi:hypothetical protein BV22DRAFT_1023633, partial [Leucogyrophana mollusca]